MSETERREAERQLEQDRAEISHTIDAISERLTPGQLIDQAMSYVRSGGGEMGSNLARQVRDNPLPLMLTGVGLAWLMASSSSPSGSGRRHESVSEHVARSNEAEIARAAAAEVTRQSGESDSAFQSRVTSAKARALSLQQKAGETADSFRQRVDDYLHRAEEAARSAKDRASAAAGRGAEAASHQANAARAGAQSAQDRIRDFYSAEPLLAGAVGVAAGLLIGGLLPATRAENRVVGEYGDQLRGKTAELAETAKDRAKDAAAEGATAAAKKATRGAKTRRSGSAGGEPA